jgi:RHS repeat-associated protein
MINGPLVFKAGLDSGPTCFHGIRQTTRLHCECSCEAAELLGSAQDTGGGRVDLHDGQLLIEAADLQIPGRGFDWRFARTYRSGVLFDGPLGHGWEFNYNRRLVLETSGTVLRMEGHGRADRYGLAGASFQAPTGYYTTLVRNPDGTFVETDRNRSRALYATPDADGVARLAELRDRNGNRMRFIYDQQRLVEVVDTLSRSIRYRYDDGGRLAGVTDFTGRTIQLGYDAEGHLVTVTSPFVVGTPNGNDFPAGRTTRYNYTPGSARKPLDHLLVEVVAPNEVAVGGPPRIKVLYEPDATLAEVARVVRLTVGGVNVQGIPAGGTIAYKYTALGGDHGDPTVPASQTNVIDRNENLSEYQFNRDGNLLRTREFSNRGLRAANPAFFETIFRYNHDGELTVWQRPEGNSREYVYDEQNPDRLQQGNLLRETRRPDARRGGDQKLLTTTYTYDPIYSQRRTLTDARGNDPSYVPQNGGANSPERYTTRYFFDYEEGADPASLAAHLGLPVAEVETLLSRANVTLGQGDLNEDGRTDQVAGNVVKVSHPSVTLLPDANMVGVEGSAHQLIEETFAFGPFGQVTRHRDAERNVMLYDYYPENDPDGDGKDLTPVVGTDPVGYLKETIRDAEADPGRNSGTDPVPVKLRRSYFYDRAGNVVREVDGRGIATDYVVTALNQVVEIVLAADVSAALANPHEPNWLACADQALPECSQGMVAFKYRLLLSYDGNGSLIRGADENRDGNTGDLLGSSVVQEFQYDILDNLIQHTHQISAAPGDTITTRYRYDRNGNQVLELSPVTSLPPEHPQHQPSNVVSEVFDERDLPLTSTQGGLTGLFSTQPAHADIPELGAIPASPDIFSWAYAHDGNRNQTELASGAGAPGGAQPRSTRRLYDGFDRPVSTVDPLGNQDFKQYDPAGRAVLVSAFGALDGTSPAGGAAANLGQPLTADSFGQPLLRQAEHKYDEAGRELERNDRWFLYDGVRYQRDGVLRGCIGGPPGSDRITRRREYDRLGRVTFVVAPDLGVARAGYDGAGRVVVENDAEGNELRLAYDDDGNLVRMAEAEITQRDAVAAGRLPDMQETFTTTYVYDSLNRLIRTTDSLGQTARYGYDSRSNLVQVSDAQHSADPADLIDDPLGLFPVPGQPSDRPAKINRPGNLMEFFHDGARRRVAGVLHLRVDGQGKNPLDVSNPSNPDGLVVIDYEWDANSRLIGIAEDGPPGNQNTSIGIIEPDNPKGTVTRFGYTDLDRFARAVFPDGSVIGHSYDAFNQLQTITDRNGSQIRFSYNSAGLAELLEVAPASSGDPHPLGGTKDASVAWQVIGTRQQTFQYDGLYRLVSSTDSDAPVAPGTGDFEASVALFAYDSADHVVEEIQQRAADPAGEAVSSCWDRADNRVLLVYPNGRQVGFTHDRLHRIKAIRDAPAAQPLVSYDYIGPRRVARRDYQNGAALTYVTGIQPTPDPGYDGGRQPVLHRHALPAGGAVASFAYNYDRSGNKLAEVRQHEGDQREAYRYDSIYRLVGVERTDAQLSWQLDGADNWTQLNGTANQVNELNEYTAFASTPLQYDTNGNLIDDGINRYQYDAFNRLRRVLRKTDDAVIAEYRYDAQNRRTRRVVTNTADFDEEIRYLYDGWQEIEDRRPDFDRQYVCGLGLDELLAIELTSGGGTVPARFFCHDDARSNIVALTDEHGAVVERYGYDPYGRPAIRDSTGASLPVSAVGNPMLFTGRRYDPETGCYYVRHRHLHPLLGRFLTRDPLGLSADIGNLDNGYTYIGNNPVNGLDPLGLAFHECNCGTVCSWDGGLFEGCDRSCDLCETREGAGGATGGDDIPGPSGESPPGGSGNQPPPRPRPKPPPTPAPPTDQELQCELCDDQFRNDQYKATRNGRWAYLGAVGTGIVGGCVTGAKAGSAVAGVGAIWGCLEGAAVGGIAGVLTGGLTGKILERNLLDDAQIAYRYCRKSHRCAEIGR